MNSFASKFGTTPLNDLFWIAGLVAFVFSALAAWVLVRTSCVHIRWTGDHPTSGPQKLHTESIARVGGVAIAIGFMAGLICFYLWAPSSVRGQIPGYQAVWLIAAAAPIFLLGLVEDVSSAVSIRMRLLAALAAGAIAWGMGGARITQLHVPLVDHLLVSMPIFSFCLTLVAVGGLVHAMNIVDGVNGLLAGIALLILGAVTAVASRFGESALMLVAVICAAGTVGFGLFNFPRARIFCGDAGAYLIGYVAAVLLVLLVLRQPAISPWFAMTVVIHPVTETLYSAWRRARLGLSPTDPDAAHMHSLWSSTLRQQQQATGHKVFLGTNAGASWRTLAMVAIPTLIAVVWPTQTMLLQTVCAAYVLAFIAIVRRMGLGLHIASCSNAIPVAIEAVLSQQALERIIKPLHQATNADAKKLEL